MSVMVGLLWAAAETDTAGSWFALAGPPGGELPVDLAWIWPGFHVSIYPGLESGAGCRLWLTGLSGTGHPAGHINT